LPLPSARDFFFPGGKFRLHPVIDGYEVLPSQEAASLLNNSAKVVDAVEAVLRFVPGVNPPPLRAVQQGQGPFRFTGSLFSNHFILSIAKAEDQHWRHIFKPTSMSIFLTILSA
jgi:hypothetical protein